MFDSAVVSRMHAPGGEVFAGDPAPFLNAQQVMWPRVVKERGSPGSKPGLGWDGHVHVYR